MNKFFAGFSARVTVFVIGVIAVLALAACVGGFSDVESNGVVEDISNEFIKVNGLLFIIDERTNFKDGQSLSMIAIGDDVQVHGYTKPSGSTYAKEIIKLESESG